MWRKEEKITYKKENGMKAFILSICLVLVWASVSFSAITKITLRAYSSAAAVGTTCVVVGGHAGGERQVTNAFSPLVSATKQFSLGTKGFRSYSASVYSATQAWVTCYASNSMTATGSTANVPVYVRAILFTGSAFTHEFPISDKIFYVK
jgi:hypothetical protein